MQEAPGPLELKCLQAIWKLGEANVKDVRDVLTKDRKLAYTTVMTTLDRLEKKGTDLSRAVVEQVIREAFDDLRLTIDTKADRQAAKVVETKKSKATKAAQAAVLKGGRQLASSMSGNEEDTFGSTSATADWMASQMRKARRKS